MERATEIALGSKVLKFPSFFASISSVKTNFTPFDYLVFLQRFGFTNYLLSAYDVTSLKGVADRDDMLIPKGDNTNIFLLDSGNYEAFWLRDKSWTSASYQKAIELTDPDLILEFDDPWHSHKESSYYDGCKSKCVPIVHGNPNELPLKMFDVALKSRAALIAVPERELGDSIVQRVSTLRKIRIELDNSKLKVSIHLLGTGNPLSILLYVAFGADSFDGLEWCQTTVNHSNGHLMHFAQRELFNCKCEACSAGGSYSAVTLGHNLLFYLQWMHDIRNHLTAGSIQLLLNEFLPNTILEKIRGTER